MARPLGTVAAATLTLFFTIAALLVFQLRNGRDPAIGQPVAQTPARVAPKRVLIRKVIVTRVIHDRAAPAAPVQPPTTTAAAPAASAPAPAPAPAPAAPAPLTTQSS
jgi:hypothetical protein